MTIITIIIISIGNPYSYVAKSSKLVQFTCVCAECQQIFWWKGSERLASSQYSNISAIKKINNTGIAINLKYSTLSIDAQDSWAYGCSVISSKDNIFQSSKVYTGSTCE